MNKITFNKTVIGASHISSNKPCQDYSISEQTDDYSLIIVSDGHGSDTYVRSDRGSRIACEVAKKHTLAFLSKLYSIPELNDIVFTVGPKPRTDSAKQYVNKKIAKADESLLQDISYFRATEGYEYLDKTMRTLFADIYNDWLQLINKDVKADPLNEYEKSRLGDADLKKAYGCTLICCIQTEDFYFAYQIGDGKCYVSKSDNLWSQPIPWDCNCFLNITTSLCQDSYPVDAFRYIFCSDRKEFPQVIFIGSDGVDGSYENKKALELDYASIVEARIKSSSSIFDSEIADFLSKKSEVGSKDDMSLCGIINTNNIDVWIELNSLKRQGFIEETNGNKIKREVELQSQIMEKQKARISELEKLQRQNNELIRQCDTKINDCNTKIERLKEERTAEEKKKVKAEANNTQVNTELNELRTKLESTRAKFEALKDTFRDWEAKAKELAKNLSIKRSSLLGRLGLSTTKKVEYQDTTRVISPTSNNLSLSINESDEIIFAKMSNDSEPYTFKVNAAKIEYSRERESRNGDFFRKEFDVFKGRLQMIDYSKYTEYSIDSIGVEYCYMTLTKNGQEIQTIFIPSQDENVFKQVFLDLWKIE